MTRLLVSVRSATEACTALAGGAGLIDIKEPTNGALGRASDSTIAEIVRVVDGRRPVSAAMGELAELAFPSVEGICYVKWGLAGSANRTWRRDLAAAEHRLIPNHGRPVAVVYADWQAARAPRPTDVVEFAIERRWDVVLFDTWKKDGRSLFDVLTPSLVEQLIHVCRGAGIRVALAGSLGLDHLDQILELQPDWLAVRGAVCHAGVRHAVIDPDRVRRLAAALAAGSHPAAISADSRLSR